MHHLVTPLRSSAGPTRKAARSVGYGNLRGIALENGGECLGFGISGKSAMRPQPAGRAAKARPWAGGPENGAASVAVARPDGRRRRFTPVGRPALHVIGRRR